MIRTLLFRVDASAQMGTGHLMRCLTLAGAWRRWSGRCVFLSKTSPSWATERVEGAGHIVALLASTAGSAEDAAETAHVARTHGAGMVVVDGYQFDAAYQRRIKDQDLPLLFFDDFGHCNHYCADLVLNQNLYADEIDYPRDRGTRLLLGPQYALLRDEFNEWNAWRRRIPIHVERLLITLGGSDAANHSRLVLEALTRCDRPRLETRLVVGPSNPNRASLEDASAHCVGPVTILEASTEMADLMAWADMAVAAGGTTSWELAFMGLPSIMLVLADNQRRVAESFDAEGVTRNLGCADDLTAVEIASALIDVVDEVECRKTMCRRGRKLVDGRGKWRVLTIVEDML